MLYKVFIDESGQKNYTSPYSKRFVENPPLFKDYPDFWRDNYFVLCGVRIKQEHLDEINKDINSLKKEYFGTNEVEVKSDWLRNPYQRKKHYLNVYDISSEKLNEFGEEFISIISSYEDEMKIIGVVFDKRFYGDEKRQSREGSPLLKTTQVLFERLEFRNGYNIVVFDQMESSLKLTKGSHSRILNVLRDNEGLQKVYVDEYTKITDVVFKESCQENFLQVADICAYNIFRQFVEFGRQWSGKRKNGVGRSKMELYEYFDKVRCNFLYHPATKQVRGVGLVCLPDVGKVNWGILEDCFENKKAPQ